MAEGKLYPFNFLAGIKKDGTNFSSRHWQDGAWMRFQRGLPRKIGGYRNIDTVAGLDEPDFRGLYIVNDSPDFDLYFGTRSHIKYFKMNIDGDPVSPLIDRTPIGFADNVNNDWNFDTMFSTLDDGSILVAHAAPNLAALDSTVETPVYYGDLYGLFANDPLIAAVEPASTPEAPTLNPGQPIVTSGGICVLHPILFIFGNDGFVRWTYPNDPTRINGEQRVTSQKIIAGFATRGGNSSPAGLLWSLDALIRVTFTPGVGIGDIDFTFDTVDSNCSIMSANCIAEFNGIFIWPGVDNFLLYNGTVNTVPNQMNLDYFYEQLNFAQRSKVWAAKVTEFNEIWWFFPTDDNVECNHAVIYNYLENSWYDTEIVEYDGGIVTGFRTCGTFNPMFGSPVWASADIDPLGNKLWEQEIGADIDVAGDLSPIPWQIFTGDLSWCALAPTGQFLGLDRQVDIQRFEPDFRMTDVTDTQLDIFTRNYAQSDPVAYGPYRFDKTTTKIDLNVQGREMRLKFSSIALGSDPQFGQNLVLLRTGDGRQ